MSSSHRPFPPSRVLIIGAGPAGLISYRNLSVYGKFSNVTLYERRDDVGGVWYLDDSAARTPSPSAPSRWPSPAYPGLIGNVLPEYLSFSQFPFPTREDMNQPFPTLDETHKYLRDFAGPFIQGGRIKLNHEVARVEEQSDGGWKVEVRDWNKRGQTRVEDWDAVVIAVGWYDHPVWPNTPGLDILQEKGLARHAKWYRGPQGNEGKRILVVGNASSGNDICAHLAPIALSPVCQSIRRPAFPGFPSLPDDRIQMIAPVAHFELSPSSCAPRASPTESSTPEHGGIDKITAHLQDGTILTDIDFVHIATGYDPKPDFVYVLDPDSHSPTTEAPGTGSVTDGHRSGQRERLMRLIDQNPQPETGTRIPSLHQHILYAYNPTLAFIGSPMSFTPFPINDISSLWLSFVWSLTIPLLTASPAPFPSLTEKLLHFEKERLERIKKLKTGLSNPSAFFVYRVLGPAEEKYAEGLRQEIVDAKPEVDEWFEMKWAPEEEQRKLRERMYPLKLEALRYARDHTREVEVRVARRVEANEIVMQHDRCEDL